MFVRVLTVLVCSGSCVSAASAAPCGSDALGTERVLTVDASSTPRVGRKQFPGTLPLAPKDVVLTFDDGPWPGPTDRVLDALARECVRATFFLLGGNASAHPSLARREVAEGHTVAYHTFSHPLLDRMSVGTAEAEIDHGIAAVNAAAYGRADGAPVAPFFRFPGFAHSTALLERMAARRIVVFGADLWASDWESMSPEQELGLVLRRLRTTGGGIILFHDTRAQTAAMLPDFLRALKAEGYHVVHVIPAGAQPASVGPDRGSPSVRETVTR